MDIDIDISSKTKVNIIFPDVILASMVINGELKKHPAGVFFQNIPIDSITGLAAIPYDKASDEGYFKIDFLNLHILDMFDSKEEMRKMLKIDPDWKILEKEKNIKKLFHIANHSNVVMLVKPTSIDALSDILALIRPNKKKLLDKYLMNKESVIDELFKRESPRDMRRSHTIAYALLIVLQMHLITMGKL